MSLHKPSKSRLRGVSNIHFSFTVSLFMCAGLSFRPQLIARAPARKAFEREEIKILRVESHVFTGHKSTCASVMTPHWSAETGIHVSTDATVDFALENKRYEKQFPCSSYAALLTFLGPHVILPDQLKLVFMSQN